MANSFLASTRRRYWLGTNRDLDWVRRAAEGRGWKQYGWWRTVTGGSWNARRGTSSNPELTRSMFIAWTVVCWSDLWLDRIGRFSYD